MSASIPPGSSTDEDGNRKVRYRLNHRCLRRGVSGGLKIRVGLRKDRSDGCTHTLNKHDYSDYDEAEQEGVFRQALARFVVPKLPCDLHHDSSCAARLSGQTAGLPKGNPIVGRT